MPRGHVLPEGSAIASLRGEAGLTQDQLAERAGYGLRTIGKIEGGHRTTAQTLAAIAAVLSECLGRSISAADLLRARNQRSERSGESATEPVVAENVQWLEISAGTQDRSSIASKHHAVLTDTACVRQPPGAARDFSFYYVMNGAVSEVLSLSHPQAAVWNVSHLAPNHQHAIDDFDSCHLLRVSIPGSEENRTIVQNRIVYAGADGLLEQKKFRAVVAYPTESLTVMVRFPVEQPYRVLRGSLRRQIDGELEDAPDQPIDITAGTLAYWRIIAPTPGSTYQLSWT